MAHKILVVEDSPTQAERVRLLLEGEGYAVELARNGREGLQRVQFALPDLIISDVMMPEMDGYAFCQAVKSVEATRRLPFVLLTDRNTPADILLGLEQGADNFITKPFEDDYLLERVQQIFAHLELREQGHVEAEIPMRVGGREMAISADKQQIIELLLATFADLRAAHDKLEETNTELLQLTLELEDRVAQRTAELRATNERLQRELEERQRAEARVLQQLARLALLHQITRAIGERRDLHSIFLVVLSRLEQDLPLAFGCLCLGAPHSDTVTVTVVGPTSQAFATMVGLEEQTVVPLDQTELRACVDGQTVSVLDTAQEHTPFLHRFAHAGLRSLVATPLLVEGSVFGLLLVARRDAQGFSSGEGEFLRQLSEHVALATHQANLYAKLQQAYNDLHQSQQVVMQQERLRALGQMASGIAHDINNAISPITLYVESLLASEPTLSARAREYLTTVQQAANDVAHTVARLREFYRQPVGLQEALPVDLNQIIPQVVELTRAKWRDEPQRLGVTIAVHTALQAEGLPPILGVESELREALINLIFNAVDAMPHGGSITLQTRATPTAVIVEVSDTGIGMDETTRQRCLEPFYTTKDVRGTGLGLAMVYGVTERHAAQLSIASAVGQGTTVRLLFPVALSQGEMGGQPAEVEESPHSLRILVVDDDPLLRKLLQDVLQAEGHVVTVVEGGMVGLAALQVARERQEPFDVVLTDLGMPEMDGREVARRVKYAAPDTPVVLLTGWGQALQQDKSLPPHVDILLSKPPRLGELRAALRAVARPAGKRADYGNN